MLSEQKAWALTGRVYELLVPLLDGRQQADDLVQALATEVGPATVRQALDLLDRSGLLEPDPLPTTTFAPDPDNKAKPAAHTWHTPISVRTVGGSTPVPAYRTAPPGCAAGGGAGPGRDGAGGDRRLSTPRTQRRQRGGPGHRNALAAGQTGRTGTVDRPWFVPGEGACHGCLARRLARNRPVHHFAATHGIDAHSPAGSPTAADLVAQEILRPGAEAELRDRILSLDRRTGARAHHQIRRNPHCRTCARDNGDSVLPPVLGDRPGQAGLPQDHSQILQQYGYLVSPLTGVVPSIVAAPEATGPVKVYVSSYHHAARVKDLRSLSTTALTGVSNGKGFSASQAKVGALFEAVERFCAERTGDEPVLTAALDEMVAHFGSDVIHPNTVMGYSDQQYLSHHDQRPDPLDDLVPEVLDRSTELDWTPVWSMTHDRTKYLPTQLLYLRSPASTGSASAAGSGRIFGIAGTNGNACGNTLDEAVLHGLCELVERDALALWWYNRLYRPGVEAPDQTHQSLLATHYRELGRELWGLDLTTDLGLPVFVAVSRSVGADERILFGAGCHPDAGIAWQRALTEMHQLVTLVLDRTGRLRPEIADDRVKSWVQEATLARHPYLAPAPAQHRPQHRPQRFTRPDQPDRPRDLSADIARCRGLLEARGLEVLLLDQTRVDVGVPTVKMIVPGLRQLAARFAPGRLYDVPVDLGWLTQSCAEQDFNPVLFPF